MELVIAQILTLVCLLLFILPFVVWFVRLIGRIIGGEYGEQWFVHKFLDAVLWLITLPVRLVFWFFLRRP